MNELYIDMNYIDMKVSFYQGTVFYDKPYSKLISVYNINIDGLGFYKWLLVDFWRTYVLALLYIAHFMFTFC